MNFSVNCFPHCRIRRFFCPKHCFCCCHKKRKKARDHDHDDTVSHGIVVLSTPPIEIRDFLVFEEVTMSDLFVFGIDELNEIRFASVQGPHLLRAILHQPVSPRSPQGPRTETKEKKEVPPALPRKTEELAGKTLKEVLPPRVVRFLLPIFQDTIRGSFVQITVLWLGDTLLLRTFPIRSHTGSVIGGTAVMCPYDPEFSQDIHRFTLPTQPVTT